MKKYLFAFAFIAGITSCNNASDDTKTNSSATDSTQTPNGMSNGSVISTDTAAMRTDSSNQK